MFSEIVFQYKLPSAYFRSHFLLEPPGSHVSAMGPLAKSSLLEILLFCCYKQPTSSMAWASLGRFFFTVVSLSVAVHTKNLGFYVQASICLCNITTRDHSVVRISHIAIFVFIYQLSSSPQQLLVVLFIAPSKWRVISTLETHSYL